MYDDVSKVALDVYMYIYVCVCKYTYICIYTYTYIYIYIRSCIKSRTRCVNIHICMYV